MITPIYAALMTLMLIALLLRVVRLRWTHRVGLGDGGNEILHRAIRIHGNFVETVPWIILLMLFMELQNTPHAILHAYGVTLIASRTMHVWGLSHSAGATRGRFLGTVLTVGLMATGAMICLIRAI